MAESGAGPGEAGNALMRAEGPAADAIGLLERFARVESQPQRLIEACEAWARIGPQAARVPGFDYLFGRLVGPPRAPAAGGDPARADGLEMLVDGSGLVVEIEPSLARHIGLAAGDRTADCFAEPIAQLASRESEDGRPIVAEFADRRGGRHLAEIIGAGDGAQPLIRVRLLKLKLAPETEAYVRRVFRLTGAETEVLSLALQRLEIAEIAKLRGNRINTIRTHINSIIRKFGCHSLNAVVTSAFEISQFLNVRRRPASGPAAAAIFGGRDVATLEGGASVAFSEGGAAGGRPLVLLHSLEYGHEPTEAFFAAADAAGFRVLAPLRPGFGGTSLATGSGETAILAAFLEEKEVENAVLVGLSTGAPAAIRLARASARIGPLVLVNYAFNAADKLKDVRPRWLAGLVDLAIRSPASARFTVAAARRLLAALGPERFYRSLYDGNGEDLDFVAAHPGLFARAGAILLGAAEEAVIADLVAAFSPDPEAKAALNGREALAIRGAATHHVGEAPMRAEAERLGVRWRRIDRAGRNCVFQRPDSFFEALAALSPAGAREGRLEPARAQA